VASKFYGGTTAATSLHPLGSSLPSLLLRLTGNEGESTRECESARARESERARDGEGRLLGMGGKEKIF
jgi:hypothetical protein